MNSPPTFEIERENGLLIVTPLIRVSELSQPGLSDDYQKLLESAGSDSVARILVDFCNVEFFGSAMLEILLELRKKVGKTTECLGLCNLSDAGREVLRIARFETLCSIFDTREDYHSSE